MGTKKKVVSISIDEELHKHIQIKLGNSLSFSAFVTNACIEFSASSATAGNQNLENRISLLLREKQDK